MEQKIFNICHMLDYKNGTQISKCLGKADREDLKELKPYKELLKDEVVNILQAILPYLSTKGEPSKQSIAILKLDELGVSIDEEIEVVEPTKKEGSEPTKKKTKAIGGTTETTKMAKEIKSLKKTIKELTDKVESCEKGYIAIQRLLEIDQQLNQPKETKTK